MRSIHTVARPLFAAALLALTICSGRADSHVERRNAGPIAHGSGAATVRTESAMTTSTMVERVIELTNRERLKAGLPSLKRQACLLQSACWLAKDMSDHGYFDHRDSAQREMPARIADFHYSGYHALGENIAMGQRTAEAVVDCWMNSPGHRANILSPNFSEIGVGYVPPSSKNAYGYWVEDFGSRFDTCPVVINSDEVETTSKRVRLSIYGGDWAEEMRFSNDGTRWSDWEQFQPLHDWSLEPGTGRRSVTVQIRHADRIEQTEAAILVGGPPAAALALWIPNFIVL